MQLFLKLRLNVIKFIKIMGFGWAGVEVAVTGLEDLGHVRSALQNKSAHAIYIASSTNRNTTLTVAILFVFTESIIDVELKFVVRKLIVQRLCGHLRRQK